MHFTHPELIGFIENKRMAYQILAEPSGGAASFREILIQPIPDGHVGHARAQYTNNLYNGYGYINDNNDYYNEMHRYHQGYHNGFIDLQRQSRLLRYGYY